MKKPIGQYDLGASLVSLFTCTEGGGSFWLHRKGVGEAIEVGLDYECFPSLLGVLTHEALELLMTRRRVAFRRHPILNGDTSERLFVMDHAMFGEIAAETAWFVEAARKDLFNAWKRRKK